MNDTEPGRKIGLHSVRPRDWRLLRSGRRATAAALLEPNAPPTEAAASDCAWRNLIHTSRPLFPAMRRNQTRLPGLGGGAPLSEAHGHYPARRTVLQTTNPPSTAVRCAPPRMPAVQRVRRPYAAMRRPTAGNAARRAGTLRSPANSRASGRVAAVRREAWRIASDSAHLGRIAAVASESPPSRYPCRRPVSLPISAFQSLQA